MGERNICIQKLWRSIDRILSKGDEWRKIGKRWNLILSRYCHSDRFTMENCVFEGDDCTVLCT